MTHVSPHHGIASRVSQCTDLTIKLGSVASAFSPSFENVVFIPIKLTSTQRTWSGQRGLWRLPEVLAHCIASQAKFYRNRDHPSALVMKLLYLLIQFPFLQEPGL